MSSTYERISKMCTFPKSFWHTNQTIFDVNIHYRGEFIGMVSFSKVKSGSWWPQNCAVWDDISPTLADDDETFLFKSRKKRELIESLIKKSTEIYKQNSLAFKN